MKQTTLVAIILGVLVLVSAVQAYQLTSLKMKAAEGQMSIGSSSRSAPVAGSADSGKTTSSLPASIKELPQMVGGC